MADTAQIDESKVTVSETPPAPVTEVAAPPPATPPVETVAAPSFSFRDMAKQAGYNVEQFQGDEDAAKAFFQYVGSLQPKPESKPAPQAEPPKPAEEEWTPAAHFSKFWEVPAFKPEWDDILTLNPDTGRIEAKPHIPWGAAQQAMNEYAQWQAARGKAMKGLFESANPYQKMYEAMVPALERQFAKREQIVQELSSREEANVIDSFETNHSQWLSSDEGQQFTAYASELVHQDKLPPVRALQVASRAFKPQPNGQPKPPEPTAVPAQPEPATSFTEDALAKAGHSRGGGASSTPPSDQGSLGADDVRNMFKRAHAASKTAR